MYARTRLSGEQILVDVGRFVLHARSRERGETVYMLIRLASRSPCHSSLIVVLSTVFVLSLSWARQIFLEWSLFFLFMHGMRDNMVMVYFAAAASTVVGQQISQGGNATNLDEKYLLSWCIHVPSSDSTFVRFYGIMKSSRRPFHLIRCAGLLRRVSTCL
ncbi:hypothetical protein EDD37DRAFT_430478 [Exophiala viscosa]|uniref:Uncharacterized protein n=1 Tax=Exophiala viscosa TaxID=2486360 RepID=A0AAN6DVF4_9EURO|nr:hypothetical protein EDD36DRAFT_291956 [Exophiala viscosa]KAI1623604.1 hypothetical protein EDD37DRAFT_430478 [Exophiala viscosa]